MALATIVPSVAAAPVNGPPQYHTPNLEKLKAIMPKSTLPAPDGLQLKFVGLGIGTQNYTCVDGQPEAAPGTTGAVGKSYLSLLPNPALTTYPAKLYDLGTRLNNDGFAKLKISTLSALALGFYKTPKLLDAFLKIQGYERVLGDHYFTGPTPTFSLNKIPANPFPLAFVKRGAFADAPKTACPGTQNEGAVQWLQLTDAGNSQGGINTVYRIETAGGKAPKTCAGKAAHFEMPYAAQYWVFGPK
jgi:hypothetical protein